MSYSRLARTLCVALTALAADDDPLIARQRVDERVVVQGPGPMLPAPRDVMPPPQQAASGTALVEGVVVSADLGRPVRRATVRLSPVVPGPPQITTSDDAGRFRFEGLEAGDYQVEGAENFATRNVGGSATTTVSFGVGRAA